MDTLPDNPLRRTPKPQRPPGAKLSPEDVRQLEASAIAPEVRDARGYWTATSRSQLVGMFPKWQRRAPALVVPMFSPDGESTRAQIKPRTPRKRDGKTVKYETAHGAGLILDVHPFMLEAVRDPRVPLLITEGVKTGDSATSRGRCTVVLAGVECWQSKGVPLPCWEHIPLEGRRVFVCFDADVLTKPEVQRALARLVAFLEDRGGVVRVVYLPRPGGLDDNLAAGERLAELELAARPFDAEALAAERLERTPGLRDATGELWRLWRAQSWSTRGDYSARSIQRALIRRAERVGRTVARGVEVEAAKRPLAEEAGVSDRAVTRNIPRLEELGMLERLPREGRKRDAPGGFVLLTGANEGARYCPQNGGSEAGGEGEGKGRESFSHLFTSPSDRGGDTNARGTPETVPELRFSTVLFYRDRDQRGRWVRRGEYLARLEKKRGRVVEALVEAGGRELVAELVVQMGSTGERKRPRDFIRRTLRPLVEAGVIVIEGDAVALTERWREALDDARELAGELRDARLQAARHRLASAAYRTRDERPADPVPDMTPIPDMRQSWALHATGCACPSCEERLGRVIGEHVEGCCCAVCFTARKYEDGGRVVALPRRSCRDGGASKTPPPASVVVLHEEAADDWRDHPLDCPCIRCSMPQVRYATPWRAS